MDDNVTIIDVIAQVTDNTNPGADNAAQTVKGLERVFSDVQSKVDSLEPSRIEIAADIVNNVNDGIKGILAEGARLVKGGIDIAINAIDFVTGVIKGIMDTYTRLTGQSLRPTDMLLRFGTYEQTMASIQSIEPDVEMSKLSEGIGELATGGIFDRRELAAGAKNFITVGSEAEDVIYKLDHATTLAAATGSEIYSVSRFVNSLALMLGDYMDMGQMIDSFAMTVGLAHMPLATITSSWDLMKAQAFQAGMAVDDVNASLIVLANNHYYGSRAGTGFAQMLRELIDYSLDSSKRMRGMADMLGINRTAFMQMFQEISEGTADVTKLAERFGYAERHIEDVINLLGDVENPFSRLMDFSMFDEHGAFREYEDWLMELASIMDGFETEAERASAMQSVFGVQANRVAELLLQNADDVSRRIDELGEAGEAFDGLGIGAGMAGIRGETIESALSRLSNAVGEIETAFFYRVGPWIYKGIEWVTGWLEGARDGFDEFLTGIENRITEMISSDEWTNADFFGKVRIAWDTLIADPFSDWWDSTGRDWASGVGRSLGEAIMDGVRWFASENPLLTGLILGKGALSLTATGLDWAAKIQGFFGGGGGVAAVDALPTVAAGGVPAAGTTAGAGATKGTSSVIAGAGGWGAILSDVAVLAGAGTAIYALVDATSNLTSENLTEQITGGVGISTVLLGTAIGTAIKPGLGTAIGAGIGGVIYLVAGDSIGEAIAGWFDGTTAMARSAEEAMQGIENYRSTYERARATAYYVDMWHEGTRLGDAEQQNIARETLLQLQPDRLTERDFELERIGETLTILANTGIAHIEREIARLEAIVARGAGNFAGMEDRIQDSVDRIEEAQNKIDALRFAEYDASRISALHAARDEEFNRQMEIRGARNRDWTERDRIEADLLEAVNSFNRTHMNALGQTFLGYEFSGDFDSFIASKIESLRADIETEESQITRLLEDYAEYFNAVLELNEIHFGSDWVENWSSGLLEMSDTFNNVVAQIGEINRAMIALPTSTRAGVDALTGALRPGGRTFGFAVPEYAEGGILSHPHLGIVAEDGPEAIIPLSGKRRDRGIELWEQTGQILGVTPYGDNETGAVAPLIPTGDNTGDAGGGTVITTPVNFGDLIFDINIDAGEAADAESIIAVLKSNIRDITDELAHQIAIGIEKCHANMPITAEYRPA